MATSPNDSVGWNHPASEFERNEIEKNGRKLKVYSGRYLCNEIEMEFHATEQISLEAYDFRGTISAISPEDGQVLQVTGHERNKRLESLVRRGKYPCIEEAEKHRDKALNVSRALYGNGLQDEDVKKAVENAAEKLFARHAPLMQKVLRQSSRPNSITPAMAFAVYANDYFKTCYQGRSSKSIANYQTQIGALMRKLPNKPMSEIKPSEVVVSIRQLSCSKSEIHRCNWFWEYLLDNRYCTGSNPIPSNAKRRESAESRQRKSKIPSCLDLTQQDKLFTALTAGRVTGSNCGIALYAWSNFDDKTILTWRMVHFDSNDPTLVIIDRKVLDNAGATHDFTAPVLPFCALVLRNRYELLLEKYTEVELENAPVISKERNPLKALSNQELFRNAGHLLRNIGVKPDTFGSKDTYRTAAIKKILLGTYKNDISTRIGLYDDSGTMSFLCAERIRDTTSDNYTKFNAEDGMARIHAAEMVLSPVKSIENPERLEELPDGRIKYTYYPDTTRGTVGIVCGVYSPPDSEITILCAHGTDGIILSREVKADGSVRRITGLQRNADASGQPKSAPAVDNAVGENANAASPPPMEQTCSGAMPSISSQEKRDAQDRASPACDSPGILPAIWTVEPCAEEKQRNQRETREIPGQESLF